ncbi:MAG TPA: hypothetical protein VF181_04345 [Balneolaceae bacterium]
MNSSDSIFPKQHKILVLLLGLLVFSPFNLLQAQNFDYKPYPKLDFDFTNLELTLGLQPQNLRLNGAATYQIKANISGADTVILYASRLDISSVLVDESKADFMLHNDSLFIPLSQPSERGQTYELYIRYSASPRFGLLRNASGTVWTSQLPQSQRHWVPIVDNPHVTLQTIFNISVPSGFNVRATGIKTGQEAASVDVVTYHFATDKEVPASSLAFSIGRFNHHSTVSGDTKINLVVEDALADTVDAQQLLKSASGYLAQIEEKLQREYPFAELDIMVLEDHNWETRSWAASTIFLYKNRGDLQVQLMRGIAAQWFGVYQRAGQWSQADAITLYQTVIQQSMPDSTALLEIKDQPSTPFTTVYDNFGVKSWNEWQKGFSDWERESLKTIIMEAAGEVLSSLPQVIGWDNYAEYWYRKSGQPLFDAPVFYVQSEDTVAETKLKSGPESDSVAYRVDYSLDEAASQLTLNFSSVSGSYDELTTLKAYEVYPSKTDTVEVTFTGAEDSIVLKVSPMISTLRLEIPKDLKLRLDEYKPANFLIYELRNGESVEQRAEAARKLGLYAENPDLQLVITDFMNRETNPKVKAALLSSYGDITKGASGTGQVFIDALESENIQVRDAALMALQNYKNDPSILNRVEQFALNAQGIEAFRKGVKVLTAIASAEEFSNFVENLMARETMNRRAIFAIQQLANMGEVEDAVKKASLFVEPRFDYEIRSTALKILIQHNQGDWLARAKELLNSFDPRIRYLTVTGFQQDPEPEAREFLQEYMQDEYDARVYFKIEQLLRDE